MMRIKFFLFFVSTGLCCGLFAQQSDNDLISIKQKLLMHKSDDLKEEVDSFHTLHLIVAGNIYQTEKHINYAYNSTEHIYDFKDELKYVQPILNLGDITIANLKTSFADNVQDMFSAPDEFALAIKYSGINGVMHANMHTANVNRACLKRTRDVLNEFDMYHTGAFTDLIERTGNYPLIIVKKGFKIAILNYANMVNRPEVSRDFFINEIDKSYIDKDMRMVQASKPDFTIVYFDWAENASEAPSHQQQEIVKYVFEKGADLVVGACNNNPMNLDFLNYYYKGKTREGIVAYSLGNLIASDEQIQNRNGYIVDMEIKKNNFNGETHVSDWGVLPVYTYYDTTSVPGKTKVYSVPCWAVESGDIFPKIPYIEKRRVVNSAYGVRKMLGAVADEVQYNMTEHVVDNVAEAIHITNASLNNRFSQKKAWEIKPTAAPVLPVALNGSSETPSLAKVHDDSKKSLSQITAAKNNKAAETNYVKEKEKAAEMFGTPVKADPAATNIETVQSVPVPDLNNSKTATGIGQAPIKTVEPQKVNAANNTKTTEAALTLKENAAAVPITNSEITANTKAPNVNAVDASTQPGKAIEADNVKTNDAVKKESAPVASSNLSTGSKASIAANTDVKEPAKAIVAEAGTKTKDVKPSASTEDEVAKKKAAPTETASDEAARKKSDTPGSEAGKTGTAANTNYHTTGNPYQLPETDQTTRPKNNSPVIEKERAKADAVEMSPVTTSKTISTKAASGTIGSMAPVAGKTLSVVMDTVWKIQFYAMKTYLPLDTNYYPHLKGYDVYEDNGLYKYVLGEYHSYKACYDYWKGQIQPRYKESFIVKFINGKRVLK